MKPLFLLLISLSILLMMIGGVRAVDCGKSISQEFNSQMNIVYDSCLITTSNQYLNVNVSSGSFATIYSSAKYNFTVKSTPFNNAIVPVTIPTYDGTNHSLHPNIYYNSTGYNGWKYWMVMTPYHNDSNYLENPSIVVSNDTYNWSVPTGLINPIINYTYFCNGDSSPINPDFGCDSTNLADPDILYDNGTLRVYFIDEPNKYNQSTGNIYYEQLWMINSTNGITWSNPQIILNKTMTLGTYLSNRADYGLASPSIVKLNGIYYLWNVKLNGDSSSGLANTIERYNSTDGVNFGLPQTTTLNLPDYVIPWHIDINWISSKNEYWMFYAGYVFFNNSKSSWGNFGIYFANSTDGLTWNSPTKSNLLKLNSNITGFDGGEFYKPTWLVNETDYNVTLIYSAKPYNPSNTSWTYGESYALMSDIIKYNASNDGMTISLWTKPSNQASSNNRYIFAKPFNPTFGELTFRTNGGNIFSDFLNLPSSAIPYNNNSWTNLISTIDGDYFKTFKDGLLISLFNNPKQFTGNLTNLNIGAYTSASYNGTIDELRIYNTSIINADILAINKSGILSNASLSNISLIAWFKFNGGKNLTDEIYDNNGTIRSATFSFENYLFLNNTGTSSSQINISKAKSLLAFYLNGTTPCSDLSNCNSFNITLNSGESIIVINNFNLTEGVNRQNSPIWISSSTSTEKHIASNLTNAINSTIVVNVDSCKFKSITYIPNGSNSTIPSYSCQNNILSFIGQINPSIESNVLLLSYKPVSSLNDNQFAITALNIALGLFSLAIVLFGLWSLKYYYDEGELTAEKIITISILIILGVVFVQILSQIINGL